MHRMVHLSTSQDKVLVLKQVVSLKSVGIYSRYTTEVNNSAATK